MVIIQAHMTASAATLLQSSYMTSSAAWSSWRRYTCPGIGEDTDRMDAGRTGRRSSARNRSRTAPYLQQHDFNFTTWLHHIFHSFLFALPYLFHKYFSPQTAYILSIGVTTRRAIWLLCGFFCSLKQVFLFSLHSSRRSDGNRATVLGAKSWQKPHIKIM